jgi:hypothetical protein
MTRVVCLAGKGHGSNEESRIVQLLQAHRPEIFPFDRARKARSALELLRMLRRSPPSLVVLEGTGLAPGLALIAARLLLGVPFVVSSGDAVGPFLRRTRPWVGPLGTLYEIALYRASSGFIGWTPYLAGRALTLGAPRAITAEHWADLPERTDASSLRAELRLPETSLVFGLVGALNWNSRVGYCYGLELVRAIRRVARDDVAVVIAGDGSGLSRLREEAGDDLGRRVFLLGAIPRSEISRFLAALDVASLPQSVDGVGAFRYTTKLPEYLHDAVPVVTGQLPFAYDLDEGWLWRLPGRTPWGEQYVSALAALMAKMTLQDLQERREQISSTTMTRFDLPAQRARCAAFVGDILDSTTYGWERHVRHRSRRP